MNDEHKLLFRMQMGQSFLLIAAIGSFLLLSPVTTPVVKVLGGLVAMAYVAFWMAVATTPGAKVWNATVGRLWDKEIQPFSDLIEEARGETA